jgi:ubiquinone/menaquinone biosynthesis C-methylase UbiE
MSKDLFSQQAATYAKYRPTYPPALIEYILSFVSNRSVAWDVATGNGQAALLLSNYFEKIMATDYSEKQLDQAILRNNIFYSLSGAEKTGFSDNSFDLITIAQAYHWLNFEEFQKEATRVAKPGAIIAAWGYNIPQSGIEKLDNAINYFYKEVVGSFWDVERKFIEAAYQTIPFSFEPLPGTSFAIEVKWSINDLAGYFQSWSSVQHFINNRKFNPVEQFLPQLANAWPTQQQILSFNFPLFMRIGRVTKEQIHLLMT